jgi:anaerobic magnesium-protoporphyrin IX monomethyl ester cyclase
MAASSMLEMTTAADGGRQTARPWDGPVLVAEDLSQQRLPARRMVAILRQAGLPAELVDVRPEGNAPGTCLENTIPLVELAHRTKPRLIVFSILFADHLSETLGTIAALRRAGIHSHLALAGPLPSLAAHELLASCPDLDSVLCGDPESAIVELTAALSSDGDWHRVPGLTFRALDGVILTRPHITPGSLDRLPPPVQDGPVLTYEGAGFATVEASRGCYHRCSFCLPAAFHRATGAPYRLRSIEGLVNEIETLYRRGARLFLFDDEQFLPQPRLRESRVAALCDELRRRDMTIAFTLKCRADDVEPGLFRSLKGMGLVRAYVGVESGCQSTLDLFAKGVSVERNLKALAILDRLGIVADMRCLLFHPWSSLEMVEEDLAFWRRAAPTIPGLLSFHEVEIFPGTPLAERCRAEGNTSGPSWASTYLLADPRAELLRRLGRLVFSASAAYRAAQSSVAQAWFAIVLRQRFHSAQASAAAVHQLRAAVERLNAGALATWSEMLAFVRQEDIYDAGRVNGRAAEWTQRLGHEWLNLKCEVIEH